MFKMRIEDGGFVDILDEGHELWIRWCFCELWDLLCVIEDVDYHKKENHKEWHPTRNNLKKVFLEIKVSAIVRNDASVQDIREFSWGHPRNRMLTESVNSNQKQCKNFISIKIPGNNMKMQGIREYQTFWRFLPHEILHSIVLLLRSSTRITRKKLKYSAIVARKEPMWMNS